MASIQNTPPNQACSSRSARVSLGKIFLQTSSSFILSAGAWLLTNKYGLQLGGLMLLGFMTFASAQLLLCRWANRVPKSLVLGAVVGGLIPAVLIVGLIS